MTMKHKASYGWFLQIHPDAQRKFNKLQTTTKFIIFRKVRELLVADDPYTLPGVEMLEEARFGRMRKIRAGDFRIFFVVRPGNIEVDKFTYKGKLYLLDIRDRKEAY